MKKTPLRLTALTVSLAGALLIPAAAASAGPKAGLDTTAENGGSNGWGNCGYNSSGGNPHTALDDGGKNKGNGGFAKGDTCEAPAPEPEPEPVVELPDFGSGTGGN